MARRARQRYGPVIDAQALLAMLEDSSVVRHPTEMRFDDAKLEPGEFAWPEPGGWGPRDGFILWTHPIFADRPWTWPYIAAYHIPSVNYGPAATQVEAEAFGAALLDQPVEAYYQALCALADAAWPGRR